MKRNSKLVFLFIAIFILNMFGVRSAMLDYFNEFKDPLPKLLIHGGLGIISIIIAIYYNNKEDDM